MDDLALVWDDIDNVATWVKHPKEATFRYGSESVQGFHKFEQNEQRVTSYPNPNNKIFSIQTSTNIKTIEVLDVLGSHIKSFQPNINLFEINISENPSGIYFLKISLINGNIVTKKIICK